MADIRRMKTTRGELEKPHLKLIYLGRPKRTLGQLLWYGNVWQMRFTPT